MSCSGAYEISSGSAVYSPHGQCNTATYRFGDLGWGFYDCFGRPVGNGFYSNGFRNYGPRIIIKPRNTVNSSNRRGSVSTAPKRGRRTGGSAPKAPKAQLKKSGAELFFQNCAVCHLNGVAGAPHPSEMKLSLDVVKNGKGAMPSFSHLNDEEINQIFYYIKNTLKIKR